MSIPTMIFCFEFILWAVLCLRLLEFDIVARKDTKKRTFTASFRLNDMKPNWFLQ